MIDCSLLDSFRDEEFLVLFGVFTARVNLSSSGLIRGLDRLAGSHFLLVLVRFSAMLEIIWCDRYMEVM